ncbi:hypothetical protein [Kitasatospora griseola]|uniref:hypothetical protein n=1 Tax=Kitasatospora griseola TaxID=2064 RepID=UPI003570A18B
MWTSRALPGRAHGLTDARTHRTVKSCVRLHVPHLADMAHTGAGGTFELGITQRSSNRAHARLRHPVERGVAALKRWRIPSARKPVLRRVRTPVGPVSAAGGRPRP